MKNFNANQIMHVARIAYRQAQAAANHSLCAKSKVGACAVSADGNLSKIGWNHHPSGLSCECEKGETRPETWHAERHAIADGGMAVWSGGLIAITRRPCLACAQRIIDAGFKFVVYGERRPCMESIILLTKADIVSIEVTEE